MKATNMPSSLPMLPGNVYADPTVTRYHKTQLLGVKDNTICGKYQLRGSQLDREIQTVETGRTLQINLIHYVPVYREAVLLERAS